MKVLGFRNVKELPTSAKVIWAVALVMALIGMTLILLDMFEVVSIKLWISLLFVNLGLWTNVIGLAKYRDQLYQ